MTSANSNSAGTLTSEQRVRLEEYLRNRQDAGSRPSPIQPRHAAGPLPLSYPQQQVWLHSQIAPDLPVYHETMTIYRRGPLDAKVLERALNEILRRHEAWRINIRVINGEPMQVVHPELRVSLPVRDFTDLPEGHREEAARGVATAEARRLFNLSDEPLFRALLCRVGPEDYRLYLTFHHIIFDGISGYQIFWRELLQLYSAFLAGRPSPLPNPALQYSDFTLWQREWIAANGIAGQMDFWKREWKEDTEPLTLRPDRPRPALQTMRGALHRVHFSQALSEEIVAFSRREGATPFMTLLTAFEILLQRYTGQDVFAIGTIGSGRARSEFEEVLGCFQNPLALRATLGGDPTFRELLQRNRTATLDALSNGDVPIELLVHALNLPHDPGRNPLFQALFTVVPALAETDDGWHITQLDLETGTSKFDIYLELDVQAYGITGRFMYNTDLFDRVTIESMAARFETLLAGIVEEPDARISDLPLLTDAERHKVLVEWNNTKRAYPANESVHQLFEAQAARRPSSTAVVFNNEEWTYGELNERANEISAQLRGMGVRPGDIVGVCLNRSPGMIATLLGILKAGAAYLPLDPELPAERLAFLVDDCSVGVVVTEHSFISRLPRSAKFLRMDVEATPSLDAAAEEPPAQVSAMDLAYVMHTSGSTGVPKGVAVCHRNIVRLVFGADYAEFGPDETFLQLAPLSFDASTFEIWGPLLHGGRCVLYPGAVPSIEELGEVLQKNHVSTLWLTSSLFDAVIDHNPKSLRNVKQLLIGGEALSPSHVRRALELLPETRIINGYGPTEGTTFTCCYGVSRSLDFGAASIPIGRPIANTQVYILDARGNPVPPGIVGELYIGGDGLARGYFHRPELTAEKFVPNPFDADPAARLYRSGDRARFLPDGNIEFCGRTDDQVKIRGHRIEPAEVEAALLQLPGVKEAVVIVHRESSGERKLVAYWVPTTEAADAFADALRDALRRMLPSYLVPSAFVKLDHMPLTANGKVGRAQLRPPARYDAGTIHDFKKPSDETESRLLHIWESVLGRSHVGVNDDFFELGGHSLLAVRLVHRIEQEFGRRLPLSALFQAPSVERMAALLRQECPASSWECLVPIEPRGTHFPFFCIHGVGGTLLRIRELTRRLKEDQPVYGFEARGLDGNRPPLQTIQEMAALYITEMRSLQPQGPYYLGGLSFGGIVAFEMAQQIHALGQEVGLLALFDTYPGKVESRLDLLRKLFSFPVGRIFNYVRRKTWGYIRTSVRAPLRMGVPQSLKDVKAACRLAAFGYVPQPYPGRVTVFQASDRALRGVDDDPQAGWGEWARGGVEIHNVPGTHMSMMTEPNVRQLAAEVQECLERVQVQWEHQTATSAGTTGTAVQGIMPESSEPGGHSETCLSGAVGSNGDRGDVRRSVPVESNDLEPGPIH
jgi:aspartate racemase